MSRRTNPPLPAAPFGLLLVEGGDERAVCEALVGPVAWAGLRCWVASGRDDLPALAGLAKADPNLGMLAEPGLRFHQAFSMPGGIDPGHAVFDPLRQFLLAL